MPRNLRFARWFPATDAPLVVTRVPRQSYIVSHRHDFGELVLILSGTATHYVYGTAHRLSAGDVFVIPEGVAHEYRDLNSLGLINICFDRKRLHWPLADLAHLPGYQALFDLEPRLRRRGEFQGRLRLGLEDLAWAEGLVRQMETEQQKRPPAFRFQMLALFMQLVCFLSRRYGQVRSPEARNLVRLGSVLAYLEKHLAEPISLGRLAGVAHMSPSTLLRTFRAALGTTPIRYLLCLRTRKAADRLQQEDKTITEVALETGFSDANYFARCFRKIFGVSPSVYRRRAREEEFLAAGTDST